MVFVFFNLRFVGSQVYKYGIMCVDPNPLAFVDVTSGSLHPTCDKLAPTCILLLNLHKDGLTLMKSFVPKL